MSRALRRPRLEALADDRYASRGPGRGDDGNFVVNEIRVFVMDAKAPDDRRRVKIREAEADFSQGGYAVEGAVDGKSETGWAVAAESDVSFTTADDSGLGTHANNSGATLVLKDGSLPD